MEPENISAPPEEPAGHPNPLEVWRMTAPERAMGGFGTTASLGAMALGLATEWLGPNEYALGSAGSHAFQHTHNIWATGAATGGASFLIQTGVGLTVAWALNRCPEAIDKLRERMSHRKNDTKAAEKLTIATGKPVLTGVVIDPLLEERASDRQEAKPHAVAALGRITMRELTGIGTKLGRGAQKAGRTVGSSAMKVGRAVGRPLIVGSAINLAMAPESGRKRFSQNAAKVLGWSAIVGAGADLIGTGGAQLLVEGAEHGFEPQAQFVVSHVLPNPLTYATLFGGIYGLTKSVKFAKQKLPPAFDALNTKAHTLVLGRGKHTHGRENVPTDSDSK